MKEELLEQVRAGRYINLQGRLGEKTPDMYPYEFDDYIEWISEGYFDRTQTIITSESLYENDPERYNEISMRLWGNNGQFFDNKSPKEIEAFLSSYFGYDIVLECVEKGVNSSKKEVIWKFYCHKRDMDEELKNDESKSLKLQVLDMHRGYDNNLFGGRR